MSGLFCSLLSSDVDPLILLYSYDSVVMIGGLICRCQG